MNTKTNISETNTEKRGYDMRVPIYNMPFECLNVLEIKRS